MLTTSPLQMRKKVRRLTLACLLAWVLATLAPVFAAQTSLHWGPWPLDFWLAAQGSVLAYLLIVVVYATLVNRWERQAQALSFTPPECGNAEA